MFDRSAPIRRSPTAPRPILKWAGGKTQLLAELHARKPKSFQRYIEPFFGGGAFFFDLEPETAIVADSNPELVNLYREVAARPDAVIGWLRELINDEETFYRVRAIDWTGLVPADAAARTIFLNRTCFNGLYRVNKSGQFNVPFGRYANPKILDEEAIRAASRALSKAEIVLGDYSDVLKQHAREGDFIFLDPPYVPISDNADFKRYTKEQFSTEDQFALADEVDRLVSLGCHVVLTNSDHPMVHQMYSAHEISVVPTRRFISCDGANRTGHDVIVTAARSKRPQLTVVPTATVVPAPAPQLSPEDLSDQVHAYPTTRYMGSKTKLLDAIWTAARPFETDTVVDLFSGSGVVGYMFKAQGKRVISNDHMAMSAGFTRAMVQNSDVTLAPAAARQLLVAEGEIDSFVRDTFSGLYYSPDDELAIDVLRTNIRALPQSAERDIALAALMRACMKKRARGIFTYTGLRYDDGRKDLQTSLADHFLNAVDAVNGAVFSNGAESVARHGDAMDCPIPEGALVYMDPPYWSPLSDNEYVRRYHFIEGLARDWQGVEIQVHTKTRKFKSYETPFKTRAGATTAFDVLLERCAGCPVIISYSSNSEPTLEEMKKIIGRHKKSLNVVRLNHTYSFGTQGWKKTDNNNAAEEFLFVGW
jgi:DNA adenine methylase